MYHANYCISGKICAKLFFGIHLELIKKTSKNSYHALSESDPDIAQTGIVRTLSSVKKSKPFEEIRISTEKINNIRVYSLFGSDQFRIMNGSGQYI